MYKIYFTQALRILRQNPFISLTAICGTALAVMMIMTIIVSEEIKNVSLAPEINRSHTFYMTRVDVQGENYMMKGNSISAKMYREYFTDFLPPQDITLMHTQDQKINRPSSENAITASVKYTDAGFWNIFSFSFIEGKPFSTEIVESGVKEAVITEKIARTLFNTPDAVNMTFEIEGELFRTIGVVKNISPVFTVAYSDIWVPYTSMENYNEAYTNSHALYKIVLLLRDKKDITQIIEEIKTIEKKHLANTQEQLTIFEPVSHRVFRKEIRAESDKEIKESVKTQFRKRIFILLLLLLIPSINLAALSISRMKKRIEEIGIRKAFGAKQHVILTQVLFENLITSVIGSFIGLLLSYVIIFQMKEWLLGLPADEWIPFNTLVSFPVIFSVSLLCIIINLLSAGIPAYKAANTSIISSITQNDKNNL